MSPTNDPRPDIATDPLMAMTYALSWTTRQRLLVKIGDGATTVRELADALRLPLSTVRDNLRALESVQLVTKSPEGATVGYRQTDVVSTITTDTEIVIRVEPPGRGSLEITYPPTWLYE
jgi:predicted transcriptional regulator